MSYVIKDRPTVYFDVLWMHPLGHAAGKYDCDTNSTDHVILLANNQNHQELGGHTQTAVFTITKKQN
jgi:hypothetical protein